MSTQDFKAKLASTGQRPIFHQQDYLSLMCELLISIDEKLDRIPGVSSVPTYGITASSTWAAKAESQAGD